ncbi:N-acetyltransferase family protein [Falsiroseomonas sp. HW251]|uniref:GNAT family N-acetyltransferase n=1 Tax=Falsiroseomonas sp. HW251 TaxID=3390998 RepID=UPI003D31EEBB
MGLRAALPEDAAALGAMHAASWAEAYPPLVEAGLIAPGLFEAMTDPARRGAAWAGILARPGLPGGVIMAEEDGEIIGFASVARTRDPALGTQGELTGLYLLRRAQGRGIATALLGAGFAALRQAGLTDAGAWAVEGNLPAERFYAARGAVPGPRRVEHRGPHALAETGWTWKDLGPS